MKKRLVVFQSAIHSYRAPIWLGFSKVFNLQIFVRKLDNKFLTNIQVRKFNKIDIRKSSFLYQKLISFLILKKVDYFWISIDTKNIFLYFCLFICKIFKTKIILHSQGLYELNSYGNLLSKVKILLHFLNIFLSDHVILYSDIKKGPYSLKIFKDKISVVNNRDSYLEDFLLNNFKSKKDKIAYVKTNNNILVIGRAKGKYFVEFLLKIAKYLNEFKYPLKIKFIGDVKLFDKQLLESAGIICLGPVRDPKKILYESEDCSIGFYPTDAGLSITSYHMLGLLPVFHSNFCLHNGPEPSIVYKKTKCFLFERQNFKSAFLSLDNAYKYILENKLEKKTNFIKNKSYSDELLEILK